jgi:hypothetical protein
MIELFSNETFFAAKSEDLLPLRCNNCDNTFYAKKKNINQLRKSPSKKRKLSYCGLQCKSLAASKIIYSKCSNCGLELKIELKEFKKSKSGNHFCSRSCSTIYNNTHKTIGTRRSKLEQWLEQQLKLLYPSLGFVFNGKEAINSELDIYIPELKLAFELNGIFHYEPIYGPEKLASIQNNDERKFQACLERNIELTIIDSSSMIHFKTDKAQKYLYIINAIINQKL